MNPMQAQYRSYAQSTQRSPHNPGTRRGPGPMLGGAPGQNVPSNAHVIAQRQQQQQEIDAAKRRAKKPTDKNIPDGVEELLVGDGVREYKELREVERRLDAIMMRKRMDLQESRLHSSERPRTMRIWISNTCDNQPWQGRGLDENAFDFSSGLEASYRVKIEGRLLHDEEPEEEISDDESESNEAEAEAKAMDHAGEETSSEKPRFVWHPRRKLSHFFKAITVEYDRAKNLQSDGAVSIEWKKPALPSIPRTLPAIVDFDCLEFERKGDENINCTINLYRDEMPERYAVSRELAEVIDKEEGTRESIVTAIYEYVNAMNLQHDEEKRVFQCDDRLRDLFRLETVNFPDILNLLVPHLSPLPPIRLAYTIRVDPDFQASPVPTVYDVTVSAEDTLRAQMHLLLSNPDFTKTLQSIATLDDKLAVIVQAINHSRAKHSFYASMSKEPVAFLRKWLSSQKRDLEIILGEATRANLSDDWLGEEYRRGGHAGVWGSENVRESVGLMVAKQRYPAEK